MIPQALAHILEALEAMQKEPKSREAALVVTKLEEAAMWFNAIKRSESHAEQERQAIVR